MPDFEREPWDEYDWERFLQQQDHKTEKYMELLEKYLDDPQRDEIIAREMGWSDDAVEGIAIAGYLHDIGKLILASNFPSEDDQVIVATGGRTQAVLEAEQKTFGANHADIGGYLLGLWGLPVPVVEAGKRAPTPRCRPRR